MLKKISVVSFRKTSLFLILFLICSPHSAESGILSSLKSKLGKIISSKPQEEKEISRQELFSRLAKSYQKLSRSKKTASTVDVKKAEKQMREVIQFARKNDRCNNRFCGPTETIRSCPQDCGTAPAICGDGTCALPELTTCIRDCLITGFDPNDYTAWCDHQEGMAHDLYCPHCGDGVANQPTEECDNGDANNDLLADACRTDCKNPRCGDGIIDFAHGEQCEPGPFCTESCRQRPPPPSTCTCKNPSDPKTCPTPPVSPKDPHHGTCTDPNPWTRVFNGEPVYSMVADVDGNLYAVSRGSLAGIYNYIVRKIDACGQIVWTQGFSGGLPDGFDHIDIDRCGNAYVVGISAFGGDLFVRKLGNGDGEELWNDFVELSSVRNDTRNGIAVYENTAGAIEVYVGYGSEVDAAQGLDLRMRKYNGFTGDVVSTQTFNNELNIDERLHTLAVDEMGNLYIAGRLAPGENATYAESIPWVAKFNPDMGFLWQIDDASIWGARVGLDFDSEGEVYSAWQGAGDPIQIHRFLMEDGFSSPPVSFTQRHPLALLVSGADILVGGYSNLESQRGFWVAKTSDTGILTWENIIDVVEAGDVAIEQFKSIAKDGGANLYVSGSFRESLDTDTFNGIIKKYVPDPSGTGYLSDNWPEAGP